MAGEFGLWLWRNAWARGYGQEAGRAIVKFGFEKLGLSSLNANPIADNTASRHVLEKLGFTEIGRDVGYCRDRRKTVALIRMQLDKSDLK